MTSRSRLLVLGSLILAAAAWLLWPSATDETKASHRSFTVSPAPKSSAPTAGNSKPETQSSEPTATPSTLAAELNAPGGTIAADLQLANALFIDWRLNFPRIGNPVGDNAEITAALTGDNPLRLQLLPRDHRAINSAGELRDRWDTPFRFHALAGDRMEIRSAGPDRKFGTEDDAVMTPP